MPSLPWLARQAVRRIGVDLQRYPASDPLWRVSRMLRKHAVDLVLDVGANDGGYASSIRRHGYAGRILSFEPVTEPFHKLKAKTASDPHWESMRCAIGDESGKITINIAGNNAASSSVLPMLERHRQAAPSAAYVGTELVEQHRLDDLASKAGAGPADKIFLKVDVQGYERAVLDGAHRLLQTGQIVGLQMELSFTPLYEGAMTWREGFDRASDLGMTLMSLDPGFTEESGQMLQADAVFFRPTV
jgi:FkbM family methyltransferase